MLKFNSDFYADVRVEDRFTTEIRYVNGQLNECKEISVKKAFIRVFDGKMWYYSSTCNVDDIQKELDSLYVYATPNKKIGENPIVKKFEVNVDKVLKFADKSTKNVSIEQKQALVQKGLKAISSEYVKMQEGLYADRYSVYNFYSSKGADITYDYQECGAVFQLSLAKEGESFANMKMFCSPTFEGIEFGEKDVKKFVEESENYLLNAKTLEKAGSYPVILSQEVTGVFAHESFGHKSESDFMLGDETMAKEWCLGKKVGSDLLTIMETGTVEGSGYVPYDDEGTKAKVNYLIKDGVLCGRLHSATTATYLGEELTGNARAINCDYEPIVRMTSTFVKGGNSTFDELVAGIKDGFYIKSYKHGSGMSTFTIAPNLAYEIKDGKIGSPVKIAVITGNVFETLGLIDGVSNEEKVVSSVIGGCGKMEQFPLNVGMGGPHIRISKMNVQ